MERNLSSDSAPKRLYERGDYTEDDNHRRLRADPLTSHQHQNVSSRTADFIKQGYLYSILCTILIYAYFLNHNKTHSLMFYSGSAGTPIKLMGNYFQVICKPDLLHQYRVDFTPEIGVIGMKKRLVRVHESSLGQYIFDGTILYTTSPLPQVDLLISTFCFSFLKITFLLN